MTELKLKVLEACKAALQTKIDLINSVQSELSESINSETKSSAGDKHETARTKMQTEQDQLQGQLNELRDQMNELNKINTHNSVETIFLGNLVETNNGTFFISVALGKIKVEDKTVFAISPKSPIGQVLLGLKVNDAFAINGVNYDILKIT